METKYHTLTDSTTIECPDVGLTYSVLWPSEDFSSDEIYSSVWDDTTGDKICPEHN